MPNETQDSLKNFPLLPNDAHVRQPVPARLPPLLYPCAISEYLLSIHY